jgi:transcriptional regulator with XRE-family HTH domain
MCVMTSFPEWLASKLNDAGMSPAELSRKMRKDQGMVSRILRGERNPRPKTIEAICKALGVPIEEGYRAAGLLPPKPKADQFREMIGHLVDQLPTEEDKNEVEEYIRLRLRIAEGRGNYETGHKKVSAKT